MKDDDVGVLVAHPNLWPWEIELPRIEGVYATATGWVSGNYGYSQRRCSITAPNLAMPPGQTIDTVPSIFSQRWS